MEGGICALGADYYLCHGYYIIKFYSYPYNLQADLSVDGQVIYYGEMLCEGNYFFLVNINSLYYFLPNNKSINTIVSKRTNISGNFNVICYDLNDVLPPCIQSI